MDGYDDSLMSAATPAQSIININILKKSYEKKYLNIVRKVT